MTILTVIFILILLPVVFSMLSALGCMFKGCFHLIGIVIMIVATVLLIVNIPS